MGALVGIIIFLYISLQDKGEVKPKDGARSIGTSFIQTMSLLTTFPIQWPQIFVTLFNIGGAVTILGQHVVNLKCAYPAISEADVFFSQRIVWSMLPIILSMLTTLTWYLLSRCNEIDNWWENAKSSIVALLAFIWPGLCAETFAIFACKSVCGHMVMVVDLNERCWEGRHMNFAWLGIAMVIIYVVGLPVIGMLNVWRMKQQCVDERRAINTVDGYLTWGVFLSAYDERVWWWEGTVAIRKITIAAIGVFGSAMDDMQIHTLLILNVAVLVATAAVRPFGTHKLLHFLEMCTLAVLFGVLWAGSVFNDHPRCENDKGVILGWCDFLSAVVSMSIIMAVLLCIVSMVYYAKHEKFEECWDRCVGERLRRRREQIQIRRADDRRSRMNEGRVAVNPLEEQAREIELPDIGMGGTEQQPAEAAEVAEDAEDAAGNDTPGEEAEAVISIAPPVSRSTGRRKTTKLRGSSGGGGGVVSEMELSTTSVSSVSLSILAEAKKTIKEMHGNPMKKKRKSLAGSDARATL